MMMLYIHVSCKQHSRDRKATRSNPGGEGGDVLAGCWGFARERERERASLHPASGKRQQNMLLMTRTTAFKKITAGGGAKNDRGLCTWLTERTIRVNLGVYRAHPALALADTNHQHPLELWDLLAPTHSLSLLLLVSHKKVADTQTNLSAILAGIYAITLPLPPRAEVAAGAPLPRSGHLAPPALAAAPPIPTSAAAAPAPARSLLS